MSCCQCGVCSESDPESMSNDRKQEPHPSLSEGLSIARRNVAQPGACLQRFERMGFSRVFPRQRLRYSAAGMVFPMNCLCREMNMEQRQDMAFLSAGNWGLGCPANPVSIVHS